jgi:hypothetical protein
MALQKNQCIKKRDIEQPYEIWSNIELGFEWRVLKKYQSSIKERANRDARWFCAVRSPYTYGQWQYEDVLATDVTNNAQRTHKDPELEEIN